MENHILEIMQLPNLTIMHVYKYSVFQAPTKEEGLVLPHLEISQIGMSGDSHRLRNFLNHLISNLILLKSKNLIESNFNLNFKI